MAAFRKITTMPVPRNNQEYKKYRREVGEVIARKLGNSPVIVLKSYVSPEVFCAWEAGHVPMVNQIRGKAFFISERVP
jgi:hypothetical protein